MQLVSHRSACEIREAAGETAGRKQRALETRKDWMTILFTGSRSLAQGDEW